MSAGTARTERDASGGERGSGPLRRLVAAAVAAGGFAATFSVFFLAATATWAVVVVHLLLVPSSYVLEGRWPGRPGRPSLMRYGCVGALLGLGSVAVVLQAPPTWGWAAMAAGVGAVATNLGVRVAAALPGRWVAPVGAVAVIVILASALLA